MQWKGVVFADDFAEAHLSRAHALQQLGRLDEALAGADRAIALKPDLANAHRGRAVVLVAMGRAEEARASTETAAAIKVKTPPV